MKVGIVITIHNRPELTRQTLESLKRSHLHAGTLIVLIDDNSNIETQEAIADFTMPNIMILKIRRSVNPGVKWALIEGYGWCWNRGCDVVTNLDNDVKLKPDWLTKLMKLHTQFPHHILTGFHSKTKNADGSERHEVLQNGPDWCTKKSVGGINLLCNEANYWKYIYPALDTKSGNWDHMASIACLADNKPIICTVPSVIQHTGIHDSSMGHNQEQADTAADYYEKELPDVTLFGLDSQAPERLKYAAEICQLEIKFGHVALLHDRSIDSKEKYSEFIIRHLHTQFVTSHILVIQHDGYILNPEAWRDEWLEWDYIGATWVYKDGMNVGNGGFSLRSRRLMKFIAEEIQPHYYHPEDHVICRIYRKHLENNGFKFAPEEVANQFSIEAYGTDKLEGANCYSGQFGFHGWGVDFGNLPNAPRRPKTYSNKLKKFV